MTIEQTPIKDLVLITPTRIDDERGYFFEAYNQQLNHSKRIEPVKGSYPQVNPGLAKAGIRIRNRF